MIEVETMNMPTLGRGILAMTEKMIATIIVTTLASMIVIEIVGAAVADTDKSFPQEHL